MAKGTRLLGVVSLRGAKTLEWGSETQSDPNRLEEGSIVLGPLA